MKKTLLIFFVLLFLGACTQQVEEEIATSCPPDCSGGSNAVVTHINSPQDEGNVYVGDRLAVSANFEKTRVDFSPSFVSEDAIGSYYMTLYTKYLYTAYGPFSLCLTGDPYNEEECSVEGNKLTESSSVPVQILSVEEELTTVGGNAVTLRLRIEAEANLDDNAELIEIDETLDSACLLTNLDQKTTADISVILFGESYDCGSLSFDLKKEEATATCKIENLNTQRFIGGEKEYNGWIRIDYGYQEIQSVAFDVVSE